MSVLKFTKPRLPEFSDERHTDMEERIEKFFPEKEGDSALILVEFIC
jgi:hypothetical protein